MASAAVLLLGQAQSGFYTRVVWVLKLKGVEFECIYEDVRDPSPVVYQYNPIYLEVPILNINGRAIADRLAMFEYIDQVWNQNPLLPEDPLEKALVRFWAIYAENKLIPSAEKALYLAAGDEQNAQIKIIEQVLANFEVEISGKKFFGGDTPKYLDFILGWVPLWLGVIEEVSGFKVFDPQTYPSLAKWMTNFSEIPVVKENSPPRHMLLKYYSEIREAEGLTVGTE